MENADEKIQVILLDFGGVVAEEGFRQGLMAIGAKTNLGGQKFFEIAENLIYKTGYVIGKTIEKSYWNSVRQVTGIRLTDMAMRMEILRRFKLRRGMLKMVETLRRKGYFLALLSDQTNWLDELDARKHFCGDFDAVFNSYHLGKSKRDVSVFLDVAEILGVSADSCLFVDDNPDNITRALSVSYEAFLFNGEEQFFAELRKYNILGNSDIMDPSDDEISP